jgi:fused signal recognition particle receptor
MGRNALVVLVIGVLEGPKGTLPFRCVEGHQVALLQVLKQALREAVEQKKDILLCDTSGRLHTNWALMEELSKVERELGKGMEGAPHEVLLVLDGSTGLNMMNQVQSIIKS